MRQHGDVVRMVLRIVPTPVALMAALWLAAETAHAQDVQLTWVDRSGAEIETVGTPAGYTGLDLSPDGTRLAVQRNDGDGGDIWIFETDRDTASRLTSNTDGGPNNSMPVWSPDGTRIVFGAVRNGSFGLYVKRADGVGGEELLIESEAVQVPVSWSPDGEFIVYWEGGNVYWEGGDHWVLPLTGDRRPFLLGGGTSRGNGQISPDGRWIAYVSRETGRSEDYVGSPEIYVESFPTGSGKRQVSTSGGSFPRWRGDGRELYFLQDSWGPMMAADVLETDSSIQLGTPRALFDSGYDSGAGGGPVLGVWIPYAVSPDGQRFLIPRSRPLPSTVVYREVEGHEILADVYRPADDEIRPVIVSLHEGALINGQRERINAQVYALAAEKGYALVSFDFRLAPETKLPEIISDIEAAFRWLAEEGADQFHLDTDRMVATGGASGGYLTLVTGYRVQPRPKALVAFSGYGALSAHNTCRWTVCNSNMSDRIREADLMMTREEALELADGPVVSNHLQRPGGRSPLNRYHRLMGTWLEALTGFDAATFPEAIAPFEPVRNVTADYPPTLLFHSVNDTGILYEGSTMMAEQFEEHGVPFFLNPTGEDAMRDFIVEYLD